MPVDVLCVSNPGDFGPGACAIILPSLLMFLPLIEGELCASNPGEFVPGALCYYPFESVDDSTEHIFLKEIEKISHIHTFITHLNM